MVLRELGGDAVLCIGQPAHAWLSGQLAGAWGNGLFREPRPRDEVVLGTLLHDLGMAAWDAEPELNPETGWPQSFMDMGLETHLGLWRRAPALALPQSRWAALLVSMHGAWLYHRRAGEPVVDEYLREQAELQARLRDSLGVDERAARRNQELLAAWDWMSLVLCMGRLPETVRAGREIRLEAAGEEEVRVVPWPFRRDAFHGEVEGRRLDGRFETTAEMRAALADAPWEYLEVRLVP